MSRLKPKLVIMLPGTWAAVDLGDAAAIDRFVEVIDEVPAAAALGDEGATLRVRLRGLAAAGGDQFLLRTGTPIPTVVTTVWPLGEETGAPGTEPLRARLNASGPSDQRLGDTATALEHAAGFAVLRTSDVVTSEGSSGVTYWITHPSTGRLLTLDVTVFATKGVESELELYDLLATNLGWDESVLVPASA